MSDAETQDIWLLQLNDSRPKGKKSKPAECQQELEEHHGHKVMPKDAMGLALSGGGIRSATFCLGILQSLAKADWLKRVDFLSTVSGGGYIGSFLGRFFDVNRCTNKSADDIEEELMDNQSQPVTWLRSHANYLSPKGIGDATFNFATFCRNFLTVHLMLFLFCFCVLGIANGFSYYPWSSSTVFPFTLIHWAMDLVGLLTPVSNSVAAQFSFSSVWYHVTELLVWFCVIPLGLSYWVVSRDQYEEFIVRALVAVFLISIAALFATLWTGSIVVFASIVCWVLWTWWTIKVKEGHGNPNSQFRAALGRNYLTKSLAFSMWITLIVALISVVDSGGKYLAIVFLNAGRDWSMFYAGMSTSGLLVLIPLLRKVATWIANARRNPEPGLKEKVLKSRLISTILVFTLLVILPLTLVSFIGHLVYELGANLAVGIGASVFALVLSLILGSRRLAMFVNSSGHLPIYSARLSRVFLGAVNPERHRHTFGRNVSRVISGDDVPFCEYQPHQKGGPIHLVNVAVNETIDVASLRNNRDRQAENMAIGPAGINLARKYHALWTQPKSSELFPIGTLNASHPFLNNQRTPIEVEGLYLREWMAVSGAAFSPGMGKETRLGQSLLLTAANLRLGYWWDSQLSSKDRYKIPINDSAFESLRRLFFRFFAAQGLLLAEAFATFGGPWLKKWYLSDGGHFEQTGAYELIRRRVPFMVVVDVGADPDYEGDILALLARLTRIDFGAEFQAVTTDEALALGVPEEVANQLASLAELMPGNKEIEKHISLFRIQYPQTAGCTWHDRTHSWMLYIRAAVTEPQTDNPGSAQEPELPADVRNYLNEHADFPNEPTLDQFFDEQQWESYRKLGEHVGNKVFK